MMHKMYDGDKELDAAFLEWFEAHKAFKAIKEGIKEATKVEESTWKKYQKVSEARKKLQFQTSSEICSEWTEMKAWREKDIRGSQLERRP